jgi:hypothetical protein
MPKPLVIVFATIALTVAIGAVLLESAPKRSGEPAAAASAEPDSGLAGAMTFTVPKK